MSVFTCYQHLPGSLEPESLFNIGDSDSSDQDKRFLGELVLPEEETLTGLANLPQDCARRLVVDGNIVALAMELGLDRNTSIGEAWLRSIHTKLVSPGMTHSACETRTRI